MKGRTSRSASGLSEKQFKMLKRQLTEEKQDRLSSHSGELNLHTSSDDRSDEADLATSDSNQDMEARYYNRNTLYVKKINQALLRMEEGTYGECRKCEEFIEHKRLQARPTAELCRACKEAEEQREKSSHRRHKSVGRGVMLR